MGHAVPQRERFALLNAGRDFAPRTADEWRDGKPLQGVAIPDPVSRQVISMSGV